MTTGKWGKVAGYRHKYGITPDWAYYQQAQMTDPFFTTRVSEFLGDYAWSAEVKNKLINILLDRYSKLEGMPGDDFDRLQSLGTVCYTHAAKVVDNVENFSNQKEIVLEYIETIRQLLVDWIK